ncbi:hypothetical protein [Streptomyces sp. NBC_01294]|uniref:hypothetical protein n=1 Tax=Streptomyces sp. NBC_01294 TaxID=2903815 RepID=UPI002DD9A1C2|nr:hypothetical protein [Streptomyces sp. NBC_01294]WRZ60926.1 hypothetical protein OG534_33205 [Streptomyces sp. NBC_01294]
MPFDPSDVHCDLSCGIGSDGRWHGWFAVRMRADALRRLGLHPDQPTAETTHPSPPGWWHAAAERNAHQYL